MNKKILNKSDDSEGLKKSKRNGIISFVLGIIPLLLYLFCVINSVSGTLSLLMLAYYATIGIPVAIISIVTGIISLKYKINILAIIGIIVSLIQFSLII